MTCLKCGVNLPSNGSICPLCGNPRFEFLPKSDFAGRLAILAILAFVGWMIWLIWFR